MRTISRRLRCHEASGPAAISSRCSRMAGPFPDLIVIDGGKGQLEAAYEALESLGLANLVADRPGKEGRADLHARPRRAHRPGGRRSGAAPAAADPRRGAPVCHHLPPRLASEAHADLRAGCRAGAGAASPQAAAPEVRQPRRCAPRQPRRPRGGRGRPGGRSRAAPLRLLTGRQAELKFCSTLPDCGLQPGALSAYADVLGQC